ncbi:S1 RNA-binding domain-containing protein [Ferrimonas balearica]|uniref:CvfB family protein n=1 Tax=Ferrimonas balearica TaxID=44012 RepID=UPI001C99782E|nr:S1-like domain-containing RNA-binding protein [Ferrimonas balearica]MBY5992456.1 GntR family transcriptional regulator [Ferrimonas balearica]
MVNIGQTNTLTVVKRVGFGLYLDGGDLGEILLPKKWAPEDAQPGDELEVFLYLDSEDQFIATTQRPKAKVGQFASLKCKEVGRVGAFLDWGLDKDLLVPFNQQKQPMEAGRYYLVYLYVDQHTDRIAASAKLDRFLDKTPADYQVGDSVRVTIGGKSDLGYKAIVNERHWGVIYYNTVFKPLKPGQRMSGTIAKVREGGRLDVSVNPPVAKQVDALGETILAYLRKQPGGFAPLNDKADPETIKALFGVSKGVFKRTIGGLYKAERITILKDGIELR